ncbi:NAD(P)/FAD-dependent oxidoreductase [Hoeflea prorocentri]|uniref:FAD-binding oxidoreductase n=1 Tax=Hoeflea prorocentri TaxID=1922333 RepID=A0A9X3UEX2_9HYPH|nr:FAD-binding oxidoreductase [Hoeflea prorocentri]MCY6379373.1 FAD-binding oxidoreductase [Hoeflea prorocentri]MDA5397174.1 FAD-binding oxidoreductase [Hoeflea prorocentri]
MSIEIKKIEDSPNFPNQADVVVVGAGIIGVCTAYELARKGVSVALVEKGTAGGEQSGRNWGWVRQQNRDLHELPLAQYSMQRWEELGPELQQELGFRRTGILYCTNEQADLDQWSKWSQGAQEYGFQNQILTSAQANERALTKSSSWLGGVWSPTDGRAEPGLAAPNIAAGAKEIGVSLHQNCAARGVEVTNRRVAGVWTERGLIKTNAAVFAGGAWTSRLCRHHGIELPVANIGGTALQTTSAPDVLGAGCLTIPGLALRRRIDGGYTLAVMGHGTLFITPQGMRYATKFYKMYRKRVAKKIKYRLNHSFLNGPEAWGSWLNDETSPFEKVRVLDPAPDLQLVKRALAAALSEFPALNGIRVERSWGGMIDTSPDLIPVISKTEKLEGLVIASSFSGHGFALGPGAGRLAAELILNEKPFVDPKPYRLSRFSDGSAITPSEMM